MFLDWYYCHCQLVMLIYVWSDRNRRSRWTEKLLFIVFLRFHGTGSPGFIWKIAMKWICSGGRNVYFFLIFKFCKFQVLCSFNAALCVKWQNHRSRWTEDKTADLGHSGTGAFPGGYTQLLPRCCWCPHGLWHHQVNSLRQYAIPPSRLCITAVLGICQHTVLSSAVSHTHIAGESWKQLNCADMFVIYWSVCSWYSSRLFRHCVISISSTGRRNFWKIILVSHAINLR